MKKQVVLWLSALLLQVTILKGQVSDMIYSYQLGTYTEITGGTVLGDASTDDQRFVDVTAPFGSTSILTGVGLPIGFTFHFNGYDFDRFAVNANGWISLGSSSLTPSVDINSTSSYAPLSSTATNTPAYLRSRIAAFARDLQSQSGGEIRYETIGTAPNRVLVVQWKKYRKYGASGDNFNFQIRLYETTNVVEIVYGSMINNTTFATPQVGLGGTTSTDFNIRTTTTDWSATTAGTTNTATCTISNTVYPASGTTFRWTPSSCPAPVALNFFNLTATSVDLSWTSSASEFQLEYGIQGFTLGTGTRINNITTTNYQITGLTPTTNYQVYVRAICGVGDTSAWSNFSFSTPCAEISTFPWLEDFSGSTFPPNCWMRAQGQLATTTNFTSTTTSAWIADGFGNNGTTGAARVNIYSTNKYEWLITPNIDLGNGTNHYKLEFDLALTAYSSTNPAGTSGTDDKFAVVISTDGGTTWTTTNILRQWDNQGSANVYNNISTTGEHVIINLSAYTGIVRIGFYGESTVSNADNDLFIDNVTIKQLTTCPDPINLTVSNITGTTAQLAWTPGGSETSWNIEYGPAGFTQGTGTVINGVTNPYTLTGLNPGTAYTFYVQADCGGGDLSPWSTPKNFTTTQIPATLPYFIDFETGTEQWNLMNGTATNKWSYGTATAYSGTHSVYISDDNGVSNNYNITLASVVHMYRDVTFPNTTNPLTLEFAWKGYGESASFDYLKVYMIPTSQSPVVGTQLSATQLGSTYNMQNNWQTASIQLPDTLAGKTKRFVFSWYNDGSLGTQPPIAVDDIRFYVLTCPKPTNLAAANITQSSADLTWNAGGSETQWQLEWGNAGFSLGNGTLVNNISSPTFNLTGLTSSSSYSFYVRGICGAGDTSTWAGPYSFTTLCGAVTAIYTQNFDGVTTPALPNCWTSIVMSSGGTPNVQTTTTTPSTAPNCAQLFNSTASGSTTHILLISPQFSDLPTHTTQITFKARMAGSGTGVLYVGTMTDPGNPGTFSNYQTIMTLTTDWQEFTVAFNNYNGSNQFIAFKHGLGMTNQYIYIDDVSYEPIPTCPKPTNLQVSNVMATSATLSWTAGGSETSWDIEYGPAGFTHGTGSLIQNVNTTTYNLTTLNPSTAYQAYVLAQCNASDSSLWLGPISFTTTQIPATLPYVWDFENDFNGWSVVNGTQANKWFTGTAAFASPTKGAYISNTNGSTNNYDGTVTSVSHIYRDIQFPAGSEFVMTFKWKGTGESSYDYMRVFLENTTYEPTAGTLPTQNQIGKQYYNQNSTWKTDTIFFDNTVANSIKRLIFTWRNDAYVNYQPPIAIDDIDIHVVTCPKPINLAVSNQTSSSATLGWTEQGSATQWQIQYGLQGFTLGSGTNQLAFTNPVNISGLSSGTYYSYYVRSICGAGDTSFWAGPFVFYVPCDATTATYSQNFDGVTTPALPLCWTKKVIASTTSAYVQTSTSSPSSSPNCAALYNSSSQGATTHLLLVSPRFSDLPSHLNRIRFKLKGNTTEKLVVGTMTNPDNENTFTPFDTISIPSSTVWNEKVVSFLNYNGTDEYIAFKHATQSTYTYIYIDDFNYEPIPTLDLAVTQITQPVTGCGMTTTEPITIKIKNLASQPYSNIQAAYNINNGTPVIETIATTLNPGDSLLYTFTATYDFSTPGVYNIKAYTIDVADQDHTNDTIMKQVGSSPFITSYPYFDDFEANNGYWISGGVNNSWQYGVPAGTVINSAASGTHAWVTNLTGNYNNNENSWIESPCFNFSTLTNPFVSLKRIVHSESSYDGAALQASIDGGLTWQHIGVLGDPNNWYNDNSINGLLFSGSQDGWSGGTNAVWVTSMHSVASLAGQPLVKFRIVFGSDASVNSYEGFAFDDFKIFEPSDVALVKPIDSTTSYLCGLTNDEALSIWIKNVASQSINAGEVINVWYQLNNNTPVAEFLSLSSPLDAGDSIQYTFNQHVDLSALTTYLFRYWIRYAPDYNTSNDSVLHTVVHYVLTVNISGGDTVCVDPIFLPYTLTLQNNPYPYDSYHWSNETGTITGSNAMFDAPAFGWYYVTVTNGTCSATDSIFVCNQVGVTPNPYQNIMVYPTPATVQLNVIASSLPQGNYTINLTTVDGRTIALQSYANISEIKTVIPTAHLPQGVYFLTISNNEHSWKFKVIR
ncbi:MAG: fibronectin type III domain-containing protein [Bacteroidales bacterium]|nr:fibronectin type III domain-containing protein [Bacteroidales bacterium]